MAKRKIITLLTDFGTRDGYVAAIKGVLLARGGDVYVVDITHEIPPGDISAAGFVLNQVFDDFPPGTVHVAVVDPGVGTDRRILAARYASRTVVAPDNGLVSFVDERLPMEAMASVRNESYFLQGREGSTFDGRDVMAPVAAAISGGTNLARLGPVPERYTLLDLPQAEWDKRSLTGEVVYIDSFGNCMSNISRPLVTQCLPRMANVGVWANGRAVGPLQVAFAHVDPGEPLALLNSVGVVEVAVNGGHAANVLGLAVGDTIVARYEDRP